MLLLRSSHDAIAPECRGIRTNLSLFDIFRWRLQNRLGFYLQSLVSSRSR